MPRLRRLTRYRYNNAPLDASGRCLYLRDESANPASSWCPTWQPARSQLDEYECRHGMGYSTIQSTQDGIRARTRFFIPPGENLEIWELELTNLRPQAASISIFAAVEFCLWDGQDDATNFQRNYSVGEVEVVDEVIYHKTEYRERRNHFAYFACSEAVASFDTDRETFLGAYHGWDTPTGVERGMLSNSIAHGWQPVGALHVHADLKAGERRTVIFMLGYHENTEDNKFDPPRAHRRLTSAPSCPSSNATATQARWNRPSQSCRPTGMGCWIQLQVRTPDIHTDRMVNTWNVSQLMAVFNFSRSASYFESGIGRGMGFRDSNQDLLGFMHLAPARSRQRILDLAATQLPSGGAYHQYQPLTKRGNNEVGSGFNDDPLWLVVATSAYIKESGDWSILDESGALR